MRSLSKFFGILLISATFILSLLFFFRIRVLLCTLNDQPCPEEQRNALASLKGSSLFFTRTDQLVPTLITDPTILLVSETKLLPDTLHLYFSQETPKYAVQIEDHTFAVYESGYLQELATLENESSKILLITLPQSSKTSAMHLNPEVYQQLLTLTDSLATVHLVPIKTTLIDSQTVELQLEHEIKVFLDLENTGKNVASLSLLLDSAEVKELPEPITEIDLRYTFPVLRTKNE